MGRIQDALKKAEAERQRKRSGSGAATTTPTVESPILDSAEPASVPHRNEHARTLEPAARTARRAPGGDIGLLRTASMARGDFGETLLAYHDPNDYRTEQFRALRTNIHVLDPEPMVIGVTSAVDDEGATLTAANLAVSFAEESADPVLVVDADLRHAGLSEVFGYEAGTPGLVEILEGSADHDSVIHDSGIRGVSYIGSGRHVGNPGGLISAAPLRKAIAGWRKRFPRIVVVMPSVIGANDASHIGRDVEGVLFVVKLGSTPRKKTEKAIDVLAASGVPLIGCFLTNAESELAEARP